MVRRKWISSVLLGLAASGSALGQAAVPAAGLAGRTVLVTEDGQSTKCTVLKAWKQPNGCQAMQVESVTTGERLTLVEEGLGERKGSAAKIYHWGPGRTRPPVGVPVPPGEPAEVADAKPVAPPEQPKKPLVLPSDKGKSQPVIVNKQPALTPRQPGGPSIVSVPGPGFTPSGSSDGRPLALVQNLKEPTAVVYPRPVWNHASVTMPTIVSGPRASEPSHVAAAPVAARFPERIPDSVPAPAAPVVTLPAAPPIPPTPVTPPTQPSVAAAASPTPADWRQSWGRPGAARESNAVHKAETNATKDTAFFPAAPTAKPDPLADPEPYSKVAVRQEVERKLTAAAKPMVAKPVEAKPSEPAPLPEAIKTAAAIQASEPAAPAVVTAVAATNSQGEPPPAMTTTSKFGRSKLFHDHHPTTPPEPGHAVASDGLLPSVPVVQATLPATPSVPAVSQVTAQWLKMLHESIYPSQREYAVDRLAACDWRGQPSVVQELLTAAREDPAPTVRAACVRSLGQMKANSPPVILAVQALQADPDGRVRDEVVQAIAILAGDAPVP